MSSTILLTVAIQCFALWILNFVQNLETREVQNVELRLPVKQSRMDLLRFYSMWMITQVSSVSFLVYTLLVWGRGALAVNGCGLKTGGMLTGCKNITVCNANANSPEAAKFYNSIFSPLQMPTPAQCRPGRMPPSPSSRRHWNKNILRLTKTSGKICYRCTVN